MRTPEDSLPRAQIGGWHTPVNFGLSYLLGARVLIERGEADGNLDELTLPVLYLQRHSFELGLKALIVAAGFAKTLEDAAKALQTDPDTQPVLASQPHGHSLSELLDDATHGVEALGFEMPTILARLTTRLEEAERSDAALFRYELRRSGEVALPTPRIFEIGETQLLLEDAFLDLVAYPPFDSLTGRILYSGVARALVGKGAPVEEPA